MSDATYRFLVGDKLAIVVGAQGVNSVTVFRGPNRYESAGLGPISAFGQRNPIIGIGNTQAGAGFDWQIANWRVYRRFTPLAMPLGKLPIPLVERVYLMDLIPLAYSLRSIRLVELT